MAPLLKREIADREELKLPPTVASAIIVTDAMTAPQIVSGLRKAISDGRLPESARIYGPTIIPKDLAKIVIHGAHQDWMKIAEVLHELQRRRSIAKKDLLTIRIDPYSL